MKLLTCLKPSTLIYDPDPPFASGDHIHITTYKGIAEYQDEDGQQTVIQAMLVKDLSKSFFPQASESNPLTFVLIAVFVDTDNLAPGVAIGVSSLAALHFQAGHMFTDKDRNFAIPAYMDVFVLLEENASDAPIGCLYTSPASSFRDRAREGG
jgi:hypothetical protein